MAKAQAHFRLEPDLLKAIKVKAETEKVSVTDLVTRFLMQGMGLDIHSNTQNVDQTKIEENVYQHVLDRITNQFSGLEESILKRVAVRISDLNDKWEKHISERITNQFTELEERVLERVAPSISDSSSAWEQRISERVSSLSDTWEERILESVKSRESELEKRILERIAISVSNLETNWEKRISDCITKPKLNKEKIPDIQSEKRIPEENKISKPDTEKPERISNSVSLVYAEKPQEIQPENKTLTLFNTELNEQIIQPGKLTTLLNEKTNSKDWNSRKLRNLRLRQITWIKNYNNPNKKIQKQPVLPMVIENYLIDWVISNDDNDNATGKEWWIRRLTEDEAEIEILIEERKAKYIEHYLNNNV